MKTIYNHITDIQKVDGIYEIHPCNNDTISGYIEVNNGKLTDFNNKSEYTDHDIFDIESYEEEHLVYYKKIN